jgi:hypothetical protein
MLRRSAPSWTRPPKKDRHYIRHKCNKSFSATIGTVYDRLRKGADQITLVVKLLSHGCPIQAIVFAFGLDEMESLSLNEMRWNRRFH